MVDSASQIEKSEQVRSSASEKEESNSVAEKKPEKESVFYSLYDGMPVSEEQYHARPAMVMLDNAEEARPNANIEQASIVWEMRVEGGYTRLMALFERPLHEESFSVGPIRSARPNFVSRANQYHGIYVHHGGSQDGLSLLYDLDLAEVDGMDLEGSIFYRDSSTGKSAPHNSYADLQGVYQYIEEKGYTTENNGKGFAFHTAFTPLQGGTSARNITLVYDSALATVEYEYDADSHTYARYQEGSRMLDEITGNPVAVSNIILQVADSYVYDEEGHKDFYDIGEGSGYYATGGKILEITWKKSEDDTEPTQFFDLNGNALSLNPGQTWIQVIDSWMDWYYE